MTNPQPAMVPKAKEIDRRLVKEGDEIANESTKIKEPKPNQKIIVYSNKEESSTTKDLLTKESGTENKAVIPPVKKSEKRTIRVQLAAMSSESAAEDNWGKLNRLHSELFSGLKPFIEKVDLGKRGTFYRLQIGNFYNQVEAEDFCNKYVVRTQKTRADCIVVE